MTKEADFLFYLARVADKIGRPDHAVDFLAKLIQIRPILNPDERRLFHATYRNYVAQHREALRAFGTYLEEAIADIDPGRCSVLNQFIERYGSELDGSCHTIIQLIDTVLLVHATDNVARAFYHKMKGDYYRYLAEFTSPGTAHEHAKSAELSYQTALALSRRELTNSDPLYLSIALTYSICEYELAGNQEQAIQFAEKTFQEAIRTVDGLSKDDYAGPHQ
jgi:14-3-3 protein epsilon